MFLTFFFVLWYSCHRQVIIFVVPHKGARITKFIFGVMAINLHLENSRDNARLVKSKTRHKLAPRIKGAIYPDKAVGKVNPDEVITELTKRGVDISRKTLLRWEQAGMVPEAKRQALGQGRGWVTDYPDETLNEALTAQLFKDGHSLKNAEIAKARKASAEGTHSLYPLLWSYYTDRFADGKTYAEMVDIAQQVGNTAGIELDSSSRMIYFNLPGDLRNYRPEAWGDVFAEIVKAKGFIPINEIKRKDQ